MAFESNNMLVIRSLILAAIFFSINIYTQVPGSAESGLDKNFLDSLGDSIAGEVIVLNDIEEDQQIDNLFQSQTSLEKTKLLLARLREQMEAIEDRLDDEDIDSDKELEVFGSTFFRSISSTFSPINIPNPDASYIVDVGDGFHISVIGSDDLDLNTQVQRDGSLGITGFGKVTVAGLTLQEVENKLKTFFAGKLLGSETIVNLTSIRDIQVLMIGKVERSGIYTISGGSTILSAINAAGGITEDGSFRKLELIRNGKVIQEFDLYDFLVFGNNNFINFKLRAGDAIRVPAASFHVPVTGGINTPAIYELKSGEKISDVIEFAGGFSQDFFGFDYLDIFRSNAARTEFLTISQDDFKDFVLLPRDTLLVPSFDNEIRMQKKVEIIGRVNNPGTYFIKDGERLSEVIKRAGGYRSDAYIYGASLYRKTAIAKQELYATRMYADTIAHVVGSIGRPDAYLDERMLPILQEELKTLNYDGRLVTTFDLDQLAANPSKDLVLEDGDRILIPQLDKIVYLFGDFSNPSNFRYEPGFTPDDYVKLAGGTKEGAEKYVIIVNPDGTAEAYNSGLLKLRPPTIYPGSIIYAPRDVGRLDGVEFAGTLAPILSSLALSLASLNSIND